MLNLGGKYLYLTHYGASEKSANAIVCSKEDVEEMVFAAGKYIVVEVIQKGISLYIGASPLKHTHLRLSISPKGAPFIVSTDARHAGRKGDPGQAAASGKDIYCATSIAGCRSPAYGVVDAAQLFAVYKCPITDGRNAIRNNDSVFMGCLQKRLSVFGQ